MKKFRKKKGSGIIHVLTGTGGGKTTSALGVALRSVGHQKSVVVIQFMKGRRDIGEYKAQRFLRPYFKIIQFGTEDFINLKKPAKEDKINAQKALDFTRYTLNKKPDLLVLDELNLALKIKLVSINEVMEILCNIPKKTTVYITGRYAPKQIIDIADFVTKITNIKEPKRLPKPRKGIEF